MDLHRHARLLLLASLLLASCDSASAGSGGPAAPGARFAVEKRPNIVDVTSTGMNFHLPAEIPSGWTTFRYRNETGFTHFLILERMPEGRTVEDARAEVVPVFQEGMDLIIEGKFDEALAAFGGLPAWYAQVVMVGGPGLTAPGRVSETTVHLEPGTYVVECYVKSPDGTFHSAVGMLAGLTVTAAASGAEPPEPTLNVTLSNEGISVDGKLRPGRHTIEVHMEEQTVHEHFLGHDVHLVQLEEDTDLDALADWMNWSAPAGLTTAAPATFLGGSQEMPAGQTAYFTAVLRPGRYALISEIPDPDTKNFMKIFTIPTGAGVSGGGSGGGGGSASVF